MSRCTGSRRDRFALERRLADHFLIVTRDTFDLGLLDRRTGEPEIPRQGVTTMRGSHQISRSREAKTVQPFATDRVKGFDVANQLMEFAYAAWVPVTAGVRPNGEYLQMARWQQVRVGFPDLEIVVEDGHAFRRVHTPPTARPILETKATTSAYTPDCDRHLAHW